MAKKIDKKDIEILKLLQSNAKITNLDISKKVKLAPSAALERIRKLTRRGYFKGFYSRIDEKKFNLEFLSLAFIRTNSANWTERIEDEISAIPNILELYQVAGEFDYFLKIRTKSPEDLANLLKEKIGSINEVSYTVSTVALKIVKDSTEIPLDLN